MVTSPPAAATRKLYPGSESSTCIPDAVRRSDVSAAPFPPWRAAEGPDRDRSERPCQGGSEADTPGWSALKHTMICAIWHMLSTGETYRDLGADYYTRRDPERQTKRLVAQLERLGHHVTLQEAAAA